MAGAVKRYCACWAKRSTFGSEMARVLTKMTTERYCLGSPARPDCNELLVQIPGKGRPKERCESCRADYQRQYTAGKVAEHRRRQRAVRTVSAVPR